MRLYLIPFLCLLLVVCQKSYPVSGYWTGYMQMNNNKVDLSVSFEKEKSLLSSTDLMLINSKISSLKNSNSKISFSLILEDAEMVFEGKITNNEITGEANIANAPTNIKIDFFLKKTSETAPSKSYTIEQTSIQSINGVSLSAEIYKPKTQKPHPALVLVHGSSLNNKNDYRFYANFFANICIEVLIFDKRGTGESTGNLSTSSYNDLASDVIKCLETLQNRPSINKNKIGLWGYSQGAMLLPYIMSKTDIPDFLIAKSPEIVCVSEAAAFSDSIRLIHSGYSYKDGHIAAESHREIGEMIKNNAKADEIRDFIEKNANKYEFMNLTGLYRNVNIGSDDFKGYYWQERIMNFYPFWKEISIPTLVLFGEDDKFVDASKNFKLIENLDNKNITIEMFKQANHSLKKTVNPIKYPDLDWPRIVEGYCDYVENWTNKIILK